jgi:hemin uptake protein HemP
MKLNTRNMKKALLTLLIAPFIWQCQTGPSRTELMQQNDSLARETAQKETQMNQMVNTIGDIEATLRVIKEKEQLIALKARQSETDGATADQINEDIRLIYDLMVQNKERIESLEKQLKKSGVETNQLRKLVDNLNEQLKQKNLEIMELNDLLKEKNSEIDDINYELTDMEIQLDSIKTANEEARSELRATKDDMYTAYYAIGSKSELKDKNIISWEGFLFFGKTELLKDKFEKEYFAPVDIRQTDSLELFQTKVKILTSHPEGSYQMKELQNGNQTLVITDKDKFWSVSNYLVVQAN